MGNTFRKLLDGMFGSRECRVVMLGEWAWETAGWPPMVPYMQADRVLMCVQGWMLLARQQVSAVGCGLWGQPTAGTCPAPADLNALVLRCSPVQAAHRGGAEHGAHDRRVALVVS